jgi:hypothetical protein
VQDCVDQRMNRGHRHHWQRHNNETNGFENEEDEIQFGRPIKIHSENLVDLQTMKINLDLISIPVNASGICNISLILDPFQECPG